MDSNLDPAIAKLNCCHSQPAPPQIVKGWQGFLTLPPPAQRNIWELLAKILFAPTGAPQVEEGVKEFCSQYSVPPPALVPALESCKFLVQRTAALNLETQAFKQDLQALSGPGMEAAYLGLLTQYEAARANIRQAITEAALRNHGKYLVDVNWRIDKVLASNTGTQLDSTVVLLTLTYIEGAQPQQITLQLAQDTLGKLKAMCDFIGQNQ